MKKSQVDECIRGALERGEFAAFAEAFYAARVAPEA